MVLARGVGLVATYQAKRGSGKSRTRNVLRSLAGSCHWGIFEGGQALRTDGGPGR